MSGKGAAKASDAPDERLVAQHKALEKKNAAVRHSTSLLYSYFINEVVAAIALCSRWAWSSFHRLR